MIGYNRFIELISNSGIDAMMGVPCSNVSSVFRVLEEGQAMEYVPTKTEGEACAVAAGHWLSGKRAAVICQNSGVGNMINPIASLCNPYDIPVLFIVSMRGAPGFKDEQQHMLMGSVTKDLLEKVNVKSELCPDNEEELAELLGRVRERSEQRKSSAILVNPSIVEKKKVSIENICDDDALDRGAVISSLTEIFQDGLFVATTGYTYRELYNCSNRKSNFYMAGSMGHAAAIGYGIASNSSKPVVVLDGDGAVLMKLGICSTIGGSDLHNIVHAVLDNGLYESTGKQKVNSNNVDFAALAKSLGYRNVLSISNIEELASLKEALANDKGPTFIHFRINKLSETPTRPKLDLSDAASQFREFVISTN